MIYYHQWEVLVNMLIRLIRFLANLNISRTLFNVIYEWNKLDHDICSSTSYNLFRNKLSKFIRSLRRKAFHINDSVRIKLWIRLRLEFNHLRDYTFRHGFRDTLKPICPCSIETETTTHYFLRRHFYIANRSAHMNDVNEIDSSFSTLNENKFIDIILCGSDKFDKWPSGLRHFNRFKPH